MEPTASFTHPSDNSKSVLTAPSTIVNINSRGATSNLLHWGHAAEVQYYNHRIENLQNIQLLQLLGRAKCTTNCFS